MLISSVFLAMGAMLMSCSRPASSQPTGEEDDDMIWWWWHGQPADSLGGLLLPSSSSSPSSSSLRNINRLHPEMFKSYKNNAQQHPPLCVIFNRTVVGYLLSHFWGFTDQFTVQAVRPSLCWVLPCPHPPRPATPSTTTTSGLTTPFKHNNKY